MKVYDSGRFSLHQSQRHLKLCPFTLDLVTHRVPNVECKNPPIMCVSQFFFVTKDFTNRTHRPKS